jgi:mannuronan 5-epimerase
MGVPAMLAFASFSFALLQQQPKAAYADCFFFDEGADTITIIVTCDTTWPHLADHASDDERTDDLIEDEGNGEYIIRAVIEVEDGDRLTISEDDTVNWLKFVGDTGMIVNGYADFVRIKYTSWDESNDSVVDNGGSEPRAWFRGRNVEGVSIVDSEMSYLGIEGGSSKRGISFEGTEGTDIEIRDSLFHHNWYAFYTNSQTNVIIDNSVYRNNHKYAIDPHTGTSDMQITNNHVYNNGGVGIICSLNCSNVLVEGNNVHGHRTGIVASRNMHDSIVRYNEVWNSSTGIYFAEFPNNEAYGNIIYDVKRGIYFANPYNMDDGMTENNYVHNNTIYDARFGIMAFRSPFNTVANNIMDDIESYEYYVSRDSGLQIHNQTFSDDRIKGGSANSNHIEIINSGRISVGRDDPVINTDETPFTQRLESETITVDSTG